MNKKEILKKYIEDMNKEEDKLRFHFPKSSHTDGLNMEKGFDFCKQRSLNWIEEVLNYIEYDNLIGDTHNPYFPQKPINKIKPVHDLTRQPVNVNPLTNPDTTPIQSDSKKDKVKKFGSGLGAVGRDVLSLFSQPTRYPGLDSDYTNKVIGEPQLNPNNNPFSQKKEDDKEDKKK